MDSSRNYIVKLALLFVFLIIATNMFMESNATSNPRARRLCQNDSDCQLCTYCGCKCAKGKFPYGWCVCQKLPLTHNIQSQVPYN
ncbi:unnamed protein product [Lupinus luteus]|uniref:Uncharacterized protein n=1 Tax=Lupinus luteus TaxID=3873 RepID=A0AAV1W5U3_LUPLU